MAATVTQSKASAEFTGVTSFTVTFDNTVTAGSHIVANTSSWRSGSDQTLSSVADNKGNGNYNQAVVSTRINSEVIGYQMYKNAITNGGSGFQITATWNATVSGCIGVSEYAGIKTNPTVTTNSNSDGSGAAAPTSGAVAPTASSLYVAGMSYNGASTTIAVTSGGFGERLEIDENNDAQDISIADQMGVSGSKNCGWTFGAARAWTAWIAAYEEGSAVLTTPPVPDGWECTEKRMDSVVLSPADLRLSNLDLKAAGGTIYRSYLLDLREYSSFRALINTNTTGATTAGIIKLSLEVIDNDQSTVIQTFDLLTDINVTADRAEQVQWGAGVTAGRVGVGTLGSNIDFIRGTVVLAKLLVTVSTQSDAATSNVADVYLFLS